MSRGRLAGLAATAMLVFGACSSGGARPTPRDPRARRRLRPRRRPPRPAPDAGARASRRRPRSRSTITWYHIQNNDPGLSLWKSLADEYTAAHPNVTIDIQVNENEAFKTKLTTLMQQGDVPDLFQTWGGGGLRQQVEAGLVKDITADIASWKGDINAGALSMYEVDGKNYGMPFDLGLVGFWYNTKSFTDAGITTLPATWDEFLADVKTLKAKGITPIALAGKDTWTGAFYWAYLAVRECGQAGMEKAVTTGDWSDPCFVKAGLDFKQLIDLEPFQEGFLAAPWDGAGSSRCRAGHLQRRHPADGPVAAGHRERELRRQPRDGRRPRLVPVPGRRRRGGRPVRRPRRRQRLRRGQGRARPRRSTSSTTWSASMRRTGGARSTRASSRPRTAPRRRRPTRCCRSCSRVAPRRSSSSCTSTRPPRRSWAGPSTRRSQPCTPGPAHPSRWSRPSARPPPSQ